METAGKQVFMLVEQDLVVNLFKELKDIKELLSKGAHAEVEPHISHKEAAAHLGIHPDTLTRRVESGRYPKDIVHLDAGFKVYYKSELKLKCLKS